MDSVKQTYRDVEVEAKKAMRDADGHDAGDDLANLGDEVRKDLGNAGDEVREALGRRRRRRPPPHRQSSRLIDRHEARRRPARRRRGPGSSITRPSHDPTHDPPGCSRAGRAATCMQWIALGATHTLDHPPRIIRVVTPA